MDCCVRNHPSSILRRCLVRYGRLVARFARYFVVCAVAFWLLCVAGFVRLKSGDHLRDGYMLAGSRAEKEWSAFKRLASYGEPYLFVAYVVSRTPGGNLLNASHLEAIVRLNEHLLHWCQVDDGNASYTFGDFCGDACYLNDGIAQFERGYKLQSERVSRGLPMLRLYNLSYPLSKVLGQTVDLRHSMYGVRMAPPKDEQRERPRLTNIDGFELAVLNYQADRAEPGRAKLLGQWELNVDKCVRNITRRYPDVEVLFAGEYSFLRNFVSTSFAMIPYLVAGSCIMMAFIAATVLQHAATEQTSVDWRSSIVVIVAIVASPCMAATGTFGLLFWLGDQFVAGSVVVPFLTIAVGVDDAFLMLHAWNRAAADKHERRRTDGTRDERAADIFASVLGEVGTSMVVTSATNAAAFGVGAASSMAAVRTFCRFASASMVVDLLYQMTLFAPLLYMAKRRQCEKHNDVPNAPYQITPHKADGAMAEAWAAPAADGSSQTTLSSTSTTASSRSSDETRKGLTWDYCSALSRPCVQAVVLTLTALYVAASAYSFSDMSAAFAPTKLFQPGSVVHKLDAYRSKYVWSRRYSILVVVERPFALANETARRRFYDMVAMFESSPDFVDTQLWLDDYERFCKANPNLAVHYADANGDFSTAVVNYQLLPKFLEFGDFHHWELFINYRRINNTVALDNFAFIPTYKNGGSWEYRAKLMKWFRQVADAYPEFSVSIVDQWGYLIELILSLKALTMRDIVFTVISMALICTLFIPSILGVLTAAFAVCSICIGVLGGLHLWSVALDPITQVAVLMSIGFSVDYTAHVTCHFFYEGSQEENRSVRLYKTLHSVARPMLQAGGSTIAIVLPLWLIHELHVAVVFAKTTTLVVALGMLHGIVIVPTVLTLLTDVSTKLCTFVRLRYSSELNV